MQSYTRYGDSDCTSVVNTYDESDLAGLNDQILTTDCFSYAGRYARYDCGGEDTLIFREYTDSECDTPLGGGNSEWPWPKDECTYYFDTEDYYIYTQNPVTINEWAESNGHDLSDPAFFSDKIDDYIVANYGYTHFLAS